MIGFEILRDGLSIVDTTILPGDKLIVTAPSENRGTHFIRPLTDLANALGCTSDIQVDEVLEQRSVKSDEHQNQAISAIIESAEKYQLGTDDILVIRGASMEMVNRIGAKLKQITGARLVVALSDGVGLEVVDEESMARAGWVHKSKIDEMLAAKPGGDTHITMNVNKATGAASIASHAAEIAQRVNDEIGKMPPIEHSATANDVEKVEVEAEPSPEPVEEEAADTNTPDSRVDDLDHEITAHQDAEDEMPAAATETEAAST